MTPLILFFVSFAIIFTHTIYMYCCRFYYNKIQKKEPTTIYKAFFNLYFFTILALVTIFIFRLLEPYFIQYLASFLDAFVPITGESDQPQKTFFFLAVLLFCFLIGGTIFLIIHFTANLTANFIAKRIDGNHKI